jgi:hypothetical protein
LALRVIARLLNKDIKAVALLCDNETNSYCDMRSNTADRATLPVDYWLARSRDGITLEQRVPGWAARVQAGNKPQP